jgi:hypothetical protein
MDLKAALCNSFFQGRRCPKMALELSDDLVLLLFAALRLGRHPLLLQVVTRAIVSSSSAPQGVACMPLMM